MDTDKFSIPSSPPAESKHVLILGASFAGLPLAHRLLTSLPPDWTLTLLNPSTHVYWNIAAPRALSDGSSIPSEKLFLPFLPSLEAHPQSGRFRFLQGLATKVDPFTNMVTYQPITDTRNPIPTPLMTLGYAHLIVATGARGAGDDQWSFKTNLPYPQALQNLQLGQSRIASADTIVLSGAGATGVETAAEIKSAYPEKHVILVSASSGVLAGIRPDVGATALSALTKLGVELKTGAKVVRFDEATMTVELSTGETIHGVGCHIPTYGLVPNAQFLPTELLTVGGGADTDAYLLVRGTKNMWAVGDVAGFVKRQAVWVKEMVPVAEHNLLMAIQADGGMVDADEGVCREDDRPEAERRVGWKTYKEPEKDMIIVPVGNRFGSATGLVFGWRMWGWAAWFVKGRDFMVGNAKALATGKF